MKRFGRSGRAERCVEDARTAAPVVVWLDGPAQAVGRVGGAPATFDPAEAEFLAALR